MDESATGSANFSGPLRDALTAGRLRSPRSRPPRPPSISTTASSPSCWALGLGAYIWLGQLAIGWPADRVRDRRRLRCGIFLYVRKYGEERASRSRSRRPASGASSRVRSPPREAGRRARRGLRSRWRWARRAGRGARLEPCASSRRRGRRTSTCHHVSAAVRPPRRSLDGRGSVLERLCEREPARRTRRVQLGAELLDRAQRVVAEQMLDDADHVVVVEREVDVLVRDEVDRDAGRRPGSARRAPSRVSAASGASRRNDDGNTGRGRSSG